MANSLGIVLIDLAEGRQWDASVEYAASSWTAVRNAPSASWNHLWFGLSRHIMDCLRSQRTTVVQITRFVKDRFETIVISNDHDVVELAFLAIAIEPVLPSSATVQWLAEPLLRDRLLRLLTSRLDFYPWLALLRQSSRQCSPAVLQDEITRQTQQNPMRGFDQEALDANGSSSAIDDVVWVWSLIYGDLLLFGSDPEAKNWVTHTFRLCPQWELLLWYARVARLRLQPRPWHIEWIRAARFQVDACVRALQHLEMPHQ